MYSKQKQTVSYNDIYVTFLSRLEKTANHGARGKSTGNDVFVQDAGAPFSGTTGNTPTKTLRPACFTRYATAITLGWLSKTSWLYGSYAQIAAMKIFTFF